jgi:hypothetical protein
MLPGSVFGITDVTGVPPAKRAGSLRRRHDRQAIGGARGLGVDPKRWSGRLFCAQNE